jgi:hypothetical protein
MRLSPACSALHAQPYISHVSDDAVSGPHDSGEDSCATRPMKRHLHTYARTQYIRTRWAHRRKSGRAGGTACAFVQVPASGTAAFISGDVFNGCPERGEDGEARPGVPPCTALRKPPPIGRPTPLASDKHALRAVPAS